MHTRRYSGGRPNGVPARSRLPDVRGREDETGLWEEPPGTWAGDMAFSRTPAFEPLNR